MGGGEEAPKLPVFAVRRCKEKSADWDLARDSVGAESFILSSAASGSAIRAAMLKGSEVEESFSIHSVSSDTLLGMVASGFDGAIVHGRPPTADTGDLAFAPIANKSLVTSGCWKEANKNPALLNFLHIVWPTP